MSNWRKPIEDAYELACNRLRNGEDSLATVTSIPGVVHWDELSERGFLRGSSYNPVNLTSIIRVRLNIKRSWRHNLAEHLRHARVMKMIDAETKSQSEAKNDS